MMLDRVREAFEHVELDKQAGYDSIATTLRTLESFSDAPPQSVEKLRRGLEQAVLITAWNGECDAKTASNWYGNPRRCSTSVMPPELAAMPRSFARH
jgi:hypothetical protein